MATFCFCYRWLPRSSERYSSSHSHLVVIRDPNSMIAPAYIERPLIETHRELIEYISRHAMARGHRAGRLPVSLGSPGL